MSKLRKVTTTYPGGISVVYLPVNQAYSVMWCDRVLRVFTSRSDAHTEAKRLTAGIDKG